MEVARSPAELRQAFLDTMSKVAFSVSVVTTDGPAGRDGVTVTAMVSVSVDASGPILLISLNNRGRAANAIVKNGVFCVNILADDQAGLADQFAGRSGPNGVVSAMQRMDLGALLTGAPVLNGAVASFDCRIRSVATVGEHLVIFGAVEATTSRLDAMPLLHWQRSYRTLG